LFEAFSYPDVVLVGGNNLPAFALPPPAWLERWWNQPVYKGRALGYLSILDFGDGVFDIDPAFVWGCNFSIRKEQLIQYGGFHPDAFPAEWYDTVVMARQRCPMRYVSPVHVPCFTPVQASVIMFQRSG